MEPAVVAVTPRTKVRFRNDDPLIYHLSCPQNPAMAGTTPLTTGRGLEVPFDEPGVYQISDVRMPHVVGYVVVVPTTHLANPTAAEQPTNASFSFQDVQPGEYLVKVFHAGEWVARQPLVVAEGQDEVGVQIRLPAESDQHEQAGSEPAAGAQ